MLCAACGHTDDDAGACAACGADPLLSGRWRLEERRGQGARGAVYRAADLRTGAPVAIKELPLGRHLLAAAGDASAREARVLRELRHPGIPAFVDAFVAHRSLWMVQELVDGESLEDESAHHRYTEGEVLAVVDELLGVLAYLHGLSPPVVHRDIKPSNVIRRAAGRLALVDFGSVRDRLDGAESRGTAAGTFGYMAPEQLRGEATPASDIYAVGALAVRLLARVEPATLLDWNHRLRWRRHVRVQPATLALVERMVEADPRKRPADAAALRAEIRRIREGRTPRKSVAVAALGGATALGLAVALGHLFRPPALTVDPILPLPVPPGESRIDLPADEPPPPAPAAAPEPTAPEPTASEPEPEPSAPSPPTEPEPPVTAGPNGGLLEDPATGVLFPKLDEGAVVDCAHGELMGLLTAQLAHDAAFDTFQPDFTRAGWAPGPTCRWYLAFAVDAGERDLELHAVVTRGEGRGRHFVVNLAGDMREEARLRKAALGPLLAGPLVWIGNRSPYPSVRRIEATALP